MAAVRKFDDNVTPSGDSASYSVEYKNIVASLVGSALSLLDNYEKTRTREDELVRILSKILSASRLEDHPQIASVAENIKTITESIISGKIIVSRSAVSTIKTALLEIQSSVLDNNFVANPTLLNELKAILRSAKSDEKDYLFIKKLHVLLIDDDEFAQYKIQRNIGSSINLDTCSNVVDASEKLPKGQYDAVLCHYDPSDKKIVGFFNEYSRRLPIIAMSISEDPKLVQLVGKAGARDFIVKNDPSIKRLPRSLHKVTNEWARKSAISDYQKLLSTPSVRKILKELTSGSRLSQKLQSKVEYDSRLVNSLKDHEKALQNLINASYLIKRPSQLKLACPACRSINLVTNFLCQNCRASNFTRGNVLEHNKCGHADLESNFQQGNKLVCSKCSKELKLIGVDYFRIISALKCKECQNIFTIPEISYDCNSCGNAGFSLSDGSWSQIYSYEVNPDKLEEIKRNIISLSPIEDFLRGKGYEVKLDEAMSGHSQQQQSGQFDLIAEKNTDLIVVSVIGADIENAITKLLDLDNIGKFDQRRITKYAILLSEPTEVARNLIDKFGMIAILLENEREMLTKFTDNFKEQ
jgi:DNA-binding NarL/FixJ family response regulator